MQDCGVNRNLDCTCSVGDSCIKAQFSHNLCDTCSHAHSPPSFLESVNRANNLRGSSRILQRE